VQNSNSILRHEHIHLRQGLTVATSDQIWMSLYVPRKITDRIESKYQCVFPHRLPGGRRISLEELSFSVEHFLRRVN